MKNNRFVRALTATLICAMVASSLQSNGMVYAKKDDVKKITLKRPQIKSLALESGKKFKLKYDVSPKKAKKKVSFKSSNNAVVAVSKTGVIKAKKVGTAKVTIASKTKSKKKIVIKVKVYKKSKFKKAKKVTLNKTSAALKVGESISLMAKISPTKATVKSVEYASSNKKIAKVNTKGVVTAVDEGTTKITAYAKDGQGAKATCTIVVSKAGSLEAQKDTTPSVPVSTASQSSASATPKPEASKVPQVSASATPKPEVSKAPQTSASATPKPEASKAPQASASAAPKPEASKAPQASASAAPKPEASKAPQPSASASASATPTPEGGLQSALEVGEDKFAIAREGASVALYLDKNAKDFEGLKLIADSFTRDISLVSKEQVETVIADDKTDALPFSIIVGSIGNNDVIDDLIAAKKMDVSDIKDKTETYKILMMDNPTDEIKKSLIVVGSDKRGTIYGLYHISELMGVSPWVFWADAVPTQKTEIVFDKDELECTSKQPSVKYRGIFINDEAPSLTGWVNSKYGGYNEKFYEHVYELILRCKGNYFWPAMWSNVFSEDGEESPIANAELADKYGVIMGTSHHEPLCRAGEEWQRIYKDYGDDNTWDFNVNAEAITKFWEDGVKRNKPYENIYTIGMRGESDSSLDGTIEDNINLLKDVITTQKQILADHNLSDAPQVLTVYKEVEDYWHGTDKAEGLKTWKTLDDVIIMLCDDNFGNMRTLPTKDTMNRKGGWGMYYHFDYHGGPTSYEWVNSTELNKVWEQMTMAYEYGIKDMWIVNVGDLKPMEMNISYFLDMAYDYEKWGENGRNKTEEYTSQWVKQQFGNSLNDAQVDGMVDLLKEYTWLNGSCKPEVVNSTTYNVTNYNEAMEMLGRIQRMMNKAEEYKEIVSEDYQAAYFELVYFPTVASANVALMQIYSGLNQYYYDQGSASANIYAALLEKAIERDQDLADMYNNNMPGVGDKWKHMMSSPHVGFVTWSSDGWSYPKAKWLSLKEASGVKLFVQNMDKSVQSGAITMEDFTNLNQESYTVTLSNTGSKQYSYTVTPSDEWIIVSKKKGSVLAQDTFEVSVDWSKVEENKTGKIRVQAGDSTIEINVNAKVYNTKDLASKTYIMTNGYASMLAGNYTNSVTGANGAKFETIEAYGKMGQAIKAFPSNAEYDGTITSAPYVEYQVVVDEAGTYKFTVYSAPSNNIDRDNINLRYAVSTNGGTETIVETIEAKSYMPGAYSGTWTKDVKANGRVSTSNITLKAGLNTIRVYNVDPALVIQKLVVSESALKTSFFGPAESYYVGKNIPGKTALTSVDFRAFSLPGVIEAAAYTGVKEEAIILEAEKNIKYSYPVIVTEEAECSFSISGKATNGAVVKVFLGEKEIGSIELSAEDSIYTMADEVLLSPGENSLTIQCSENAEIETVRVKKKMTGDVKDIFASASSEIEAHEVALVNDGEEKTYWQSATDDENPSIIIDFDDDLYVDRFAITEKGSNIEGYVVKALEGDNWNTIYEGEGIVSGQEVMLQGRNPIKTKKIKFEFTGKDIAICELSLVPYINWTLEDKLILTGAKSSGEAIEVPASIVDGNRISTGMEAGLGASTEAKRHRVVATFSQPRSIDTVRVISIQEAEKAAVGTGSNPDSTMTSSSAQYSYKVSYLSNGKWFEIGATKKPDAGNPKVFNEFILDEAVIAEAISVEVYTSHWVRICELEATKSYQTNIAKTIASKQFDKKANEFEVNLTEECIVGRIQIVGTQTNLTFSYYDAKKKAYIEIPEDKIDLIYTESGSYAIPVEEILTNSIKVASSEEITVSQIDVYEGLKKQKVATTKDLYVETFETGVGNVSPWASADVETKKNISYNGKASILVTNRVHDWDAATISTNNFFDGVESDTEYTIQFYVKGTDANREIPLVIKFCNQDGNDVKQSSIYKIKGSDWTKVEYTFKMDSAEYEYIKIQTSGDTEDSNGKLADFYLDDIKVSVPLAPCTCNLEAPEISNNSDVEILYGKSSSLITLAAKANHSECETVGHKGNAVEYSYKLSDNSDSIATMEGDKVRIRDAGTFVVCVKATLNGYTRYGMKIFKVTKGEKLPDDYKNYAASEEGANAVVPSGGEGSAANLIDGNRTYSSSKRWRKQVEDAYVEVYFDGLKAIDQVYFYSQQEASTGEADPLENVDMTSNLAQKNLKFYYMKDGEWVLFENGNITGNNKVKCGITVNDPVNTVAIRVEIDGATGGWIRAIEVEAYGTPVATSECICQLGTPTLTCDKVVMLDKTKSTGSLALSASAGSYQKGCTVSGHKDENTEFTYSIEEDNASIAKLEGNVLSFNGMGTVKIKIKATLNGITKSVIEEIQAEKEGYVNFAAGIEASCSEGAEGGESTTAVTDGDRSYSNSKRWRTSKFPAFLEIDFGEEKNVDTLNIFFQQNSGNVVPTKDMTGTMALKAFTFSYWDETESAWVEFEAGSVVDNDKIWYQLELAKAVSTSKIRVDIPGATDGWARVIELEAWGYDE